MFSPEPDDYSIRFQSHDKVKPISTRSSEQAMISKIATEKGVTEDYIRELMKATEKKANRSTADEPRGKQLKSTSSEAEQNRSLGQSESRYGGRISNLPDKMASPSVNRN